jgi:hypothetical protein
VDVDIDSTASSSGARIDNASEEIDFLLASIELVLKSDTLLPQILDWFLAGIKDVLEPVLLLLELFNDSLCLLDFFECGSFFASEFFNCELQGFDFETGLSDVFEGFWSLLGALSEGELASFDFSSESFSLLISDCDFIIASALAGGLVVTTFSAVSTTVPMPVIVKRRIN